jgi:hypothetical protein
MNTIFNYENDNLSLYFNSHELALASKLKSLQTLNGIITRDINNLQSMFIVNENKYSKLLNESMNNHPEYFI